MALIKSWLRHHGTLNSGEVLDTLKEAQILTERWRTHYNTVRPHSSLVGQLPAPEMIQLAS